MAFSSLNSFQNSINNSIRALIKLFSNDGSSLTGWSSSNGGISIIQNAGNGAPAFSVLTNQGYIFINTGISNLAGKTISFRVYLISSGCPDFFFACDSTGSGQMLRFDSRNGNDTGITKTTSWTAWVGVIGPFIWTLKTWYDISIIISSDGVASWSANGVVQDSRFTISNNGGYIGLQGDGGGGGMYIQNIVIV